LVYAVLYFGIGAWAIIDPIKDPILDLLGLSWEIPSFMNEVGLKVSKPIGYSEVAGLYGGINIIVGLLCFLGLFSRGIASYAFSLLAFLTFSIALGRYLFSIFDPSMPHYFNDFFIFEIATFILSLSCYLYLKLLYNPRKSTNIENVASD
jgi:hypothetical protein